LRLRRSRPDERLLDLLEESASNAKRTTALLRELIEDYPERRQLARVHARVLKRRVGRIGVKVA
jgi:hypothetical protein